MEEQKYLISDAARIVKVEAHVLRYWEEELELPIGRTELGHRYYTRENIETFQKVKDLKEKGLQLKAIKTILNTASGRRCPAGFGTGRKLRYRIGKRCRKRHYIQTGGYTGITGFTGEHREIKTF